MTKKIILIFMTGAMAFSSVFSLTFSLPALAQDIGYTEEAEMRTASPRKQLAMIIFSGLGGAILGLSTLSFYHRPQDKLSNIAVGFALGVIAGTVYTTYTTTVSARQQFEDSASYLPHYKVKPDYGKELTVSHSWEF